MRVLRFFGKSLLVLLALVGLATVGLVLTVALAVSDLSRFTAKATPAEAVLVLDLGYGVIDALPDSPFARIALDKTVVLKDALRALDAAAADGRVKVLLLHLSGDRLDLAHAQELADAIARFRRSGKSVIAFAESFGEGGETNSRYLLATSASEIWMQPSGDLPLAGAVLQAPFLKDLLTKIGVVARMDHREEFKGAMNSLTENAMTAPQRANMQGLVDSLTSQLADSISRGRHLDHAVAAKLIAGGPYSGEAAKAAALVDFLGYWDQAQTLALRRAGAEGEEVDLADYVARLPGPPRGTPRIAIVYGIGEVTLDRSRGAPLVGRSNMGAISTATALHEAVDDPNVAGIIFRIDSPGGSYVAADTIWREVQRARDLHRPLVVSMGSMAASGGYFVAAPAAAIVAEPATLTGSIGVFAGKLVIKELLAKLGITVDSVAGTPNALAESMTEDYTPEQWANLQSELDRIYGDFLNKVAEGRHMDRDAVHAVAKGQVWTGADAKAKGLVDELGGLATATAAVKRLAKIAPDAEVELEQYPRPSNDLRSALSSLVGGQGESQSLAEVLAHLPLALAALLSAVAESAGPDQTLRAPLP
jgi:protease-4